MDESVTHHCVGMKQEKLGLLNKNWCNKPQNMPNSRDNGERDHIFLETHCFHSTIHPSDHDNFFSEPVDVLHEAMFAILDERREDWIIGRTKGTLKKKWSPNLNIGFVFNIKSPQNGGTENYREGFQEFG